MPHFDKPLGPWRPDLGDLQHDGMAEAEGVFPVAGGYALHPKAAAEGSATIDAIARGAYCSRDGDGDTSLFVGNASKLYQRTSTAFTDVSKSGGYSTAAADHWEFAQYDRILVATNYTDSVQKFSFTGSTAFQDLTNSFVSVGANFDGVDDSYARGAALTGAADGKTGTISFWFKAGSAGAGEDKILHGTNSLSVSVTNTALTVVNRDTPFTGTALNIRAQGNYRDDEWHHFAASWDMTDSAKCHIYVDGVSNLSVTTYTNATLDYTGSDYFIGSTGATSYFLGGIAELWFNTEYFDLSVAANLQKFRDAFGGPVDLGSDGSTPTGNQPLIYVNGGASGFATNLGTGGDFTASGSPTDVSLNEGQASPKARHAGVIGDFVFLGNTNDTLNGVVPYRVQWSSIGDPDNFPAPGTTEAQNTQSDEEYLDPEYGDIRGIAGGKDFGLVFQENAITRFSYVGGTAIFEVDPYEKGRGLIAPRAFAQVGGQTYFISNDGAYVTDGVNVQSIGDGVIDKTLIEDIDRDNLNYFSTAVDYTNKLIYFSIPNGTGSDKAYIYNYAENRWSLVNYVDLIGDATASVGCVVRGFSLDSQQVPQVFVLGGYNEGAGVLHKLREFDGDLSPFTLRTGVMEFPQITYLDGASVYGDNASTYTPTTAAPFKVYASESSAIGISGGESGTHTVTTTGSANARTGKVDFRISARTASFELSSTTALSGVTSQKIQKFRVYHKGGSQA